MKQKAILPVLTQIAQDEIPAVKGDTVKLIADLKAFLPVERLVTKPDDLFAYECDAQTFDRAVPLCVAFPETTAEVSRVIQLCCKHNVPFVPSALPAIARVEGIRAASAERTIVLDLGNARLTVMGLDARAYYPRSDPSLVRAGPRPIDGAALVAAPVIVLSENAAKKLSVVEFLPT